MKLFSIFVAALLGSAAALPLEEETMNLLSAAKVDGRNNVLEELVLGIIEELRQLMINGSDEIPVLDPLRLDNLHLDLDSLINLPNSHLTVSNVVVDNLSTFVIDYLRFSITSVIPQRYTLVLEGRIPRIDADVENYDLNVNVVGVNVFGNGRTKVRVIEPRISATIVLGVRFFPLPIGFNMISADVKFHLDAFETEFTGLFGEDEFLNDFVNSFLANLVPELVEFFEEDISSVINQLVLEIGNELLADIDLSDILGRSGMEQMFGADALLAQGPVPENVL